MFRYLVFLYILGFHSACSEYCNPISCFLYINQLVYGGKTQDICMKLPKVIHCVESCSPNNRFSKGLRNVQKNVCDNHSEIKDDILLHNKCIDRYKYRLLACLNEAWNLSNETLSDQKLVYCRKTLESINCPKKVISLPCEEDASNILEDILVQYFNPQLEEMCSGATLETIWNLKVESHTNFKNEYKKLAKCFDRHMSEVLSCVNEKWTTNILMNDNYKSGLCREVQIMINCLLKSISEECDDGMADTFRILANNLYLDLLPYCSGIASSTHLILVPEQLLDEPSTHSNKELTHSIKNDIDNTTTESSSLRNQPHVIVVYNIGRPESGAFSQHIYLKCIIFSFVLVLIYTKMLKYQV